LIPHQRAAATIFINIPGKRIGKKLHCSCVDVQSSPPAHDPHGLVLGDERALHCYSGLCSLYYLSSRVSHIAIKVCPGDGGSRSYDAHSTSLCLRHVVLEKPMVYSGKLSVTRSIKLQKPFDLGKSTEALYYLSDRELLRINTIASEQLLSKLLAIQMDILSPFSTRALFVRSMRDFINDMDMSTSKVEFISKSKAYLIHVQVPLPNPQRHIGRKFIFENAKGF